MNCRSYMVRGKSRSSGTGVHGAAIIIFSLLLITVPSPNLHTLRAQSRDSELKGYSDKFINSQQAQEEFIKGKLYYEDESYELARNHMIAALRLDNKHLGARYYLGLVEGRCGHHSLSIEHFLAVYKLEPRYEELFLELAAGSLALGRCDKARIWLDRHLKIKPESKKTRELGRKIKDCKNRQEKRGG